MIRFTGIVSHPFDEFTLWKDPLFMVDAKITTNTDTGSMILDVFATPYRVTTDSVQVSSTNPETLETTTITQQVERRVAMGKIYWNDVSISGASNLPVTMTNFQAALESWVAMKIAEANPTSSNFEIT